MAEPRPPLESEPPSPLDQLDVLAMQSVSVDDNLDHLEVYTMSGLLTLLWHGPSDLSRTIQCSGAPLCRSAV